MDLHRIIFPLMVTSQLRFLLPPSHLFNNTCHQKCHQAVHKSAQKPSDSRYGFYKSPLSHNTFFLFNNFSTLTPHFSAHQPHFNHTITTLFVQNKQHSQFKTQQNVRKPAFPVQNKLTQPSYQRYTAQNVCQNSISPL